MNKLSEEGVFRYWYEPSMSELGRSVIECLQTIKGPAHFHIPGADRSRSRAMVTLLHGNEPSGLTALLRTIEKRVEPAVDLHCFVVNVQAAIAEPIFFYRTLPGYRDLNRCFNGPFDDETGRLAEALLQRLEKIKPEAVIDLHNTSGSGPAFAVATHMDEHHDALASVFTQRMIVTDLKLGALMEISDRLCPTITIECGGAQDEASMLMAEDGLRRYFTLDSVLKPLPADFDLDYYHNPIRLELKDRVNGKIDFAEDPSEHSAITFFPNVERFNFATVAPGDPFGWVNGNEAELFSAKDTDGVERFSEYFHVQNGLFEAKCRLKLFMVTTNPIIAKSDCLFYFVKSD